MEGAQQDARSHDAGGRAVKFYVSTPGFHLRPKNTDWISERNLPQITAFDSRVEIYLQRSFWNSLKFNVRFASGILQNRTRLPVPASLQVESRFDLRDLRRSRADIIYGHSPTNVNHLPLICHSGPIFEDELRRHGVTDAMIEREKLLKRRTIDRSQLITMHSATGAETLRAVAAPKWDRIRVLPFFLPHLQVVERDVVEQKFAGLSVEESRVRMLFVGRESRRKGLPDLLKAFEILNSHMPNRLEFEVITTFADGPVDVPSLPKHRGARRDIAGGSAAEDASGPSAADAQPLRNLRLGLPGGNGRRCDRSCRGYAYAARDPCRWSCRPACCRRRASESPTFWNLCCAILLACWRSPWLGAHGCWRSTSRTPWHAVSTSSGWRHRNCFRRTAEPQRTDSSSR